MDDITQRMEEEALIRFALEILLYVNESLSANGEAFETMVKANVERYGLSTEQIEQYVDSILRRLDAGLWSPEKKAYKDMSPMEKLVHDLMHPMSTSFTVDDGYTYTAWNGSPRDVSEAPPMFDTDIPDETLEVERMENEGGPASDSGEDYPVEPPETDVALEGADTTIKDIEKSNIKWEPPHINFAAGINPDATIEDALDKMRTAILDTKQRTLPRKNMRELKPGDKVTFENGMIRLAQEGDEIYGEIAVSVDPADDTCCAVVFVW